MNQAIRNQLRLRDETVSPLETFPNTVHSESTISGQFYLVRVAGRRRHAIRLEGPLFQTSDGRVHEMIRVKVLAAR